MSLTVANVALTVPSLSEFILCYDWQLSLRSGLPASQSITFVDRKRLLFKHRMPLKSSIKIRIAISSISKEYLPATESWATVMFIEVYTKYYGEQDHD